MSRRLVIGILVVLIIGVAGGAAVLVAQRLRQGVAPAATPTPATGTPQLPGAETGTQQQVDPSADNDGDGLSNSDEQLWGTNINNTDTDGDNFADGAEVAARHNPTIPGPNDLLPDGFVPGRNVTPLETAANTPVAVDQFFERNLDLNLSGKNYTEDYRARFGDNNRTPETLNQYVQEQAVVTKLPTPLGRAVAVEGGDTPAALSAYLSVAGDITPFSNPTVVASALNDLVQNNDPASVRGLALAVRLRQQDLVALKVPPAAENLQRLLLGYSELLAATYDVIAEYPEDQVKAAVGVRQLEANAATYMPLIIAEIERLQQLAGGLAQ